MKVLQSFEYKMIILEYGLKVALHTTTTTTRYTNILLSLV